MWKRNGTLLAMILAANALFAAALGADGPVPAVAPTPPPSVQQVPGPVKTGKERLSGKASDEQRVDNCKVPPELRGTTARPDRCAHQIQAIPTD